MEFSAEVLRDLPLFASLNKEDTFQILEKFEKIDLAEEAFLFLENEPGDSLYILIKGKLRVTTNHKTVEKLIGFIRPGELVGELTIFSNEPRSASVRALYPSTVLRLKREDLQSICYKHPSILWKITKSISVRSKSNISMIRNKNQIVSVVCFEEDVEIGDLLKCFRDCNEIKFRIDFVDYNLIKSEKNVFSPIRKIVETGNTCICVISHRDLSSAREILNLSDKVIVLINSSCKDLNFLKENINLINHLEKELILLHDSYKTWYPDTQRYLSLSNFSKNYHITFALPKTIRRLLRILSGHAIGLVLSGGGAKGWATIGAMRAFYEHNVEIDYIGGTSIGSAVGACYVLSENFEQFMLIFNKVFETFGSNPFAMKNLTLPLVSIFSGKNETDKIKEVCGRTLIHDLTLPFFAISANLSSYCEHIWDKGYLWQACRASLAIPPMLPPVIYNNQVHVDGGILNNFPTDVMSVKLEHQGYIFGVDIASSEMDQQKYNFPPAITFWEAVKIKLKIGFKKVVYIGILEIMERIFMTASIEKLVENSKLCDLVIKPNLDGYKFSDFSKTKEMMEIGYQEATKQLSKRKDSISS